MNKACELSCDEKVISTLDEKAKREYGDTLISFLKSNNLYRSFLASVTLTEGAEQLKERLGAILKFRKKSKAIIAVTAIFTVTVCACFFVTGAYAAPSVANDMDSLAQEEKEFVMETAAKIDKNNKDCEYTYTQNGYYCNSYIIEMGWNLYAKNQDSYAAIEIVLEDNSKMTVCFSDLAKDDMNDSGAVSAIKELIYSLKSADISPEIEMPLIMSIMPVATDDIPALAAYLQGILDAFQILCGLGILSTTENVEKIIERKKRRAKINGRRVCFVDDCKIDSFEGLAKFTADKERRCQQLETVHLSKGQKLNRLKELSKIFLE